MSLLEKANATEFKGEKAKILQDSFDKVFGLVSHVQFNSILSDLHDTSQLPRHINLKEVVNAYKKHKYWNGIVDICLRYAQAIDPDGTGQL